MLAVTTTDPIADVILGAGFAFTVYLALRNGHKTDKAADKVSDKVADATSKLGEVHDLVNSQLSESNQRGDDAVADAAQLRAEAKG
jgi:hypothetical protein